MADAKLGADIKAAFWVAVVLVAVAALVDNGMLAWALTPIILLLLVYAAARAPLRKSIMVLMFCGFALENPNEAPGAGYWVSPFFSIGRAMLAHLNNLTGVSGMSFSGMDIMLGVLIVVALVRRSTGSRTDRAGRIPGPKIMTRLAFVSLAGVAYVWLYGLIRGGDFKMSLWQVEKVIYLPVVFLLCEAGLRGPRDHVAFGKVLLGAATLRACQAMYVRSIAVIPEGAEFVYATTHNDSILFAAAFVMLVLLILEKAGPKAVRTALLVLPILAIGMAVNNRRMVWVQVAMVLATLYLATPETPLKRKVRRILYYLLPVLLVYIAVGWNSHAGVFGPVQTLRSVVEPEMDSSSLWREIENYNLIYTIKQSPLFGQGYGWGFWEIIPLPPVDYSLELYVPHNSLLGLWCFAGFIGFSAITAQWGAGVFFAWRGYFSSKKPIDKVAAIMSVGAIIIYMVQCYGDIGLGSWTGVFTVAPTLAFAGKLAVANGAWVTKPAVARAPQHRTAEPSGAQQPS